VPERRTWYHTIDLPGRGPTPGYFDTRRAPAHVPWPRQLSGGRCLDVGTFDGFWAFEMERRGAFEVVAAMASHYHVLELTAPLAVLHSYTVPYIWRFPHAAPGHRAHLPALAHPRAHG
jgi:hypothetical protein